MTAPSLPASTDAVLPPLDAAPDTAPSLIATVAESSHIDQSAVEPTTESVQATQADQDAMLVSVNVFTRQRSLSFGASLFTSTEPTEQQTTTSAEDEEFLV